MFRFIELSLHGWDLWPPLRIPLDRDVIAVTGPNGSGKTTLLDAIRQLLNAPRLSSKRRLQHYLRRPDVPALLRAVVSNDAPNDAAPPFRAERITTPEATLACMLVPSGGGSPEKRFAILSGRPALEEVRHRLLETRDWYGPEQYARALERAGVTRSLMAVLAIEQGRTNALFELKPRELFQRVLEMLGDHDVLERYGRARRRYAESQQELARQTASLGGLNLKLQQVLRLVREREIWEQARDKVQELEARLPAADLQGFLKKRAETASKIPELRTKVRNGESEAVRLEQRLAELREAEASARADWQTAQEAEATAREIWGNAKELRGGLAVRIQLLGEMEREVAELPVADLAALERLADEAGRHYFSASASLQQAQADRRMAMEKVERLKAGLPVYPAAVTATVEALAAEQIQAVLLASMLEVTDSAVAAAAEAALGDARYALLVDPEVEQIVLPIARRCAFPGPIYAGPRLTAAETAGPVLLGPGSPPWVKTSIEAVQLHPDGTWRDDRGSWVAGVRERVLGAAGREAALTEAEQAYQEAEAAEARAKREAKAAHENKDTVETALRREHRRCDLLIQLGELPALKQQAGDAEAALCQAEAQLQKAMVSRQSAEERTAVVSSQVLTTQTEQTELLKRVAGEQEALQRTEAEAIQYDQLIRELEARVRPDLFERARRGELDGPDTVKEDLSRAEKEFAALGDPPPEEVREEARHLRANIEEAEKYVQDRQRQAEQAQAELTECRRRYLDVVEGALQDYRRRAVDLAKRAAIAVEMELPRLDDNDRILDEAGIHVRFGFDGKEPLPLGDPSFSGGQQVIAGLILLMAMAETDGRGFYMLDEPFAHLSLDRVDDVGQFLRNARAQFILTAPTTLDRAQLDPASLVIVLHKKRPQESSAPPPQVAIA